MVNNLEQVTRQRKFLWFLHADRDAGEIAGCIQKLNQMIDNFLVSEWFINVEDFATSDRCCR